MLVAMQLARYRPWACRSLDLVDLHAQCISFLEQMRAVGIDAYVRHIYREFNQSADSLAKTATHDQHVMVRSVQW